MMQTFSRGRLSDFGCLVFLIAVIQTYISAIENGINRGNTYCIQGHYDPIRVEKGDYGSISSFGFPGNYTSDKYHGQLCNVEIQACSTCRLRLILKQLDFPSCEKQDTMVKKRIRSVCIPGCDHLRMFEADQPYHSSTQKNYFAEESGFIYDSISARLVILHCMSNGTHTTGKMFNVLFEVIDKVVKIQGTVTSPLDSVISGNITSPNFPHGYALNGETFTYMIQNLDPYGHIRMIFDDWDLAEESDIQVYDDLSRNSRTSVLRRGERPILVSNTNTLFLVFNVGDGTYASNSNIGFKATYYLVAGSSWADKPLTNCSSSYLMQSGGIIKFSGVSSRIHQFYDCVWTIKRYIANQPDGVIIRIDKITFGDGWLHSGINVLDINNGLTSADPLIGRYVSTNITMGTTLHTSGKGLYIRLRGAFYSSDIISFVYTAVDNVTNEGCPDPKGYICHNLWCIDKELICDGVDHCGDRSDEVCSMPDLWNLGWSGSLERIATELTTLTPCQGHRCTDDKRCISPSQVCDGVFDCEDMTDETICRYDFYPESSSVRLSMKTLSILLLFFVHLQNCYE